MTPSKTRCLILGDVHAPFHDTEAVRLVEQILCDFHFDQIISVGDFFDCYAVSRYEKCANRKLNIEWEIEEGVKLAQRITELSPQSKHVITLGNHEARLGRWVSAHPELQGSKRLSVYHRMRELKWTVVPYKQSYELGPHLSVTHDFGRSGKYAGHQAVADYGRSVVFGHTHRASVVYQGAISGHTLAALNVGWLGDPLEIDYAHIDRVRRDSVHGVGIVDLARDGNFQLNFVPFTKTRGKLMACIDGHWVCQ